MAVRKVVKYGEPCLRAKSKEVHKISKKIQILIDDGGFINMIFKKVFTRVNEH